jgi:hypothetical protein
LTFVFSFPGFMGDPNNINQPSILSLVMRVFVVVNLDQFKHQVTIYWRCGHAKAEFFAWKRLGVVSEPTGPEGVDGGRFETLIHLVRDPLKSITSIACTEPVTSADWSSYVGRHIPSFPVDTTGKQGEKLFRGLLM